MPILGLVFNQTKVIIGASPTFSTNGVSQIANVALQQFGASSKGVVIVDVVEVEDHGSPCEVTEFPIEPDPQLAGPGVINDHVQLKPKILSIEGIVSDTPLGFLLVGQIANIVNAGASLLGGGRAVENYKALEDLQASRQPFTVITGLKRYDTMIMTNLKVKRTVDTANSIHFTCDFKQVNYVSSQVAQNLSLDPTAATIGQPNLNQGQQVTESQPIDINAGTSVAKDTFKDWFQVDQF